MAFKEVNKVEEEKEKEEEKAMFQKFMTADPTNVMAIVPILENGIVRDKIDEIELDKWGKYKRVDYSNIQAVSLLPNLKFDVLNVNGTRYSMDYVEKAQKTANPFFGDEVVFYLSYDDEKKEFVMDKPLIMIFNETLCFALAPRVEDGGD